MPRSEKNDNANTGQLGSSPRCKFCSGFEEKIEAEGNFPLHDELSAMERHEVITEIAQILGDDPALFNQAEKIFDSVRYRMAEYVLKHEYNKDSGVSVFLTLWLENKRQPESLNPLEDVIRNYFQR